MNKIRILLLEDSREFAESLQRALKDRFSFIVKESVEAAKAVVEKSDELAMAIVDMFLGEEKADAPEGMDFLKWLVAEHSHLPAIVMTAHGNMELAVDAMKAGAEDFIDKGRLNIPELEKRIFDIMERRKLRRENTLLRQRLEQYETRVLIGHSSIMASLHQAIRTVAEDGKITVLLRGETGTGKELAARMIHETGLRKNDPFVVVDASSLPKDTLASELFGYERGAFTGADTTHKGYIEEASGGILFLDEITDLPLDVQNRLLRVLEERVVIRLGSTNPIAVDIQMLAASNQDIEELVESNRFRKDLYYRLKVFEITLPPLRDHREDIPDIARHFLGQWQSRTTLRDLSPATLDLLQGYAWPGNVRELRNTLEYASLQAKMRGDHTLRPEHLPSEIKTNAALRSAGSEEGGECRVDVALARAELECVLRALHNSGGIKQKARGLLGYRDRHTMRRRIEIIANKFPKLWSSYPEIARHYGTAQKRRRK